MKKRLKLISLLSLFAIASTTFFIFAKRPAEDKPETVFVKVWMLLGKNEAWIDYGNSKIIETDVSGWGNNGASFDKYKSSSSKVLEIIQKLNLEGYKVISQSQSQQGPADVETWVLTLK